MLVLKVEGPGSVIYKNTMRKLRKTRQRHPIHVDVIKRGGTIYIFSLDDGYSAAFIYQAYLKAKEKGLRASLLYARYIDEDWIPEEVREVGKMWLSKGLSAEDVKTLRGINITEHMFKRWCP